MNLHDRSIYQMISFASNSQNTSLLTIMNFDKLNTFLRYILKLMCLKKVIAF